MNKKLHEYVLKNFKLDKQRKVVRFDIDNISYGVLFTFIEFLYTFSLNLETNVWYEKRISQLYNCAKIFECEVLEKMITQKLELSVMVDYNFQLLLQKGISEFITKKMNVKELLNFHFLILIKNYMLTKNFYLQEVYFLKIYLILVLVNLLL